MKTFVHSFLGSIVAILVLVGLVAGYASCAAGKKAKILDHSYLVIELHGDLPEYDPPGGIMSQITGGDTETLQRVLDGLAKARVDDRIEGVILKVSNSSSMDLAKVEEIRAAIGKVLEAGKKVIGYADSLADREYYLLAACGEIVAPPAAYIQFQGFARRSVHVKNALEKLGIRPNLHQIREYKSAAELVTREDMSPEARENIEWMMDQFWDDFTATLARDRKLEEDKVVELMEHAIFTTEEALAAGLVDRVMYWDEIEKMLKKDGDKELHTVAQKRYAEETFAKAGIKEGKKIAVVHAQGMIFGRKSGINPLLGFTMGNESVIADLRRARDDEDIKAVVFRVDSPGGDALSSDLISREVEIATAVKPVVVSMVGVAASGGYDISYRASRIIADPMTITGSIGSISGKFNMSGLYEKLGITHDSVTRGPMALLDSDLRDYTPAERARFEDDHWKGFNRWLEDVAKHRGLTVEEAQGLAYGRVWTGRQAAASKLVDEVGGLDRAVAVAGELAGLTADEPVTLVHYPEKKGLLQAVLQRDDMAATAARYAVYRLIHEDLADTWELVTQQPELLLQEVAP